MDAFKWILGGLVAGLSASAFYSITKGSRLFDLFQVSEDPLSESEQVRLDKLLASGKRYHNLSILLSGILLALSALENFQEYTAPFGDIVIPSVQTAIGLYLLVIFTLIATDRFLTMAYPWLQLDERRPPYDWVLMGLGIGEKHLTGIWFFLPLLVSSIGLTIILKEEAVVPETVTVLTFLISGLGLVSLPRMVSYYAYLLIERLDHRGGSATFSIYLLYWYRLIRQVIYSVYIAIPVLIVIPRWITPQVETFIGYLTLFFAVLFVIRTIASIKKVYRWIDRLGLKRGFPTTSAHYE